MMRLLTTVALFHIALNATPALTADLCKMALIDTHIDDQKTKIYSSEHKVRSLYYSADMAVNTDGTPRSYHPGDPEADKGLAFNNIANAISELYDAHGDRITCGDKAEDRKGACFDTFISTFEDARNSKYNPVGHAVIKTENMIPWRHDANLGRDVPCLNTVKPFEGYFISQTSLSVDTKKGLCDQSRYLDSLKYNAVVLPKRVNWRAGGVKTDGGDLVVVRDLESGKIAYAINGDRGPVKGIGEGTIALTSFLSGISIKGTETYAEIKKLHRDRVQYITFPADDIRPKTDNKFTQDDIDREGAKLFEEWGGVERLDACAKLD
ncbi:glycoside hydrolase family 75 protein [Rhizobium sp. Leaf453]|uniref:glycoside hydrolase family 75 protein n=1 Tax=Rhizobium sp. Leaf453 TaxID=1736380 RepID=UPI000714237C|nr:glycoside hydrolase family 75 protein [Rhizobium sp. Leaf453]KQU08041.1 hypothetical protein ASG68_23580 [Rhizobium sp. Leaf453]